MQMTAARLSVFWISLLLTGQLSAAGGVVGEAGSCILEIGFYTAHFTLYQPENSASEEFCEELPTVGKTVFVLDFLHETLKDVPVDFRIIRDLEGFGRFANLANIQQIDDIASRTVLLTPGEIHADGRMTVEYTFAESGDFIGILTAPHPTKDLHYSAVFPFKVGSTGYGYWPVVLILFIVIQVQFMLSHGIFERLQRRLTKG